MPRHKYIGHLNKNNNSFKPSNKYTETIVSFEELNNIKKNKIKLPNFQGALREEKYTEMINEYISNPELFRMKNKIIIGCLHNKWYLVDGQHRFETVSQLYNKHNIKDDCVIFCWYECKDDKELKKIFKTLNHDSIKNKCFLDKKEFDQLKIMELRRLLTEYKNDIDITIFSREKSEKSNIYSIQKFTDELDNKGFFNLKECKYSENGLNYLKKKNEEYYNKYYIDNLKINGKLFYARDRKIAEESKVIFSLKNNNFIEWLFDDTLSPIHRMRIVKEKISSSIRKKVWNSFSPVNNYMKCPISACGFILDNNKKNGWDCGHIISEKNGGATTIENLRPICKNCNQKMASKNWHDYENNICKLINSKPLVNQ